MNGLFESVNSVQQQNFPLHLPPRFCNPSLPIIKKYNPSTLYKCLWVIHNCDSSSLLLRYNKVMKWGPWYYLFEPFSLLFLHFARSTNNHSSTFKIVKTIFEVNLSIFQGESGFCFTVRYSINVRIIFQSSSRCCLEKVDVKVIVKKGEEERGSKSRAQVEPVFMGISVCNVWIRRDVVGAMGRMGQ